MPKLDFIDIGSSKGGSIGYCTRKFGRNGYGIDIDKEKVELARKIGFDVRHMSIQDVTDHAKYCTSLHVLEHLSGRDEAIEMIKKMLNIGDRCYIVFPYFDADSYLYNLGYKLFWSDWTGHPFHCTTLEFQNIMRMIGVDFTVEYFGQITSTADEAVIPLDAPIDSLGYTPDMAPKEIIKLDNVYRELRIWI